MWSGHTPVRWNICSSVQCSGLAWLSNHGLLRGLMPFISCMIVSNSTAVIALAAFQGNDFNCTFLNSRWKFSSKWRRQYLWGQPGNIRSTPFRSSFCRSDTKTRFPSMSRWVVWAEMTSWRSCRNQSRFVLFSASIAAYASGNSWPLASIAVAVRRMSRYCFLRWVPSSLRMGRQSHYWSTVTNEHMYIGIYCLMLFEVPRDFQGLYTQCLDSIEVILWMTLRVYR